MEYGKPKPKLEMRTFDTGATRDTDEGKYDYTGFLSHDVLERFAEYMHKNRKQSDGKLRSAGNWKKGIPLDVYMESKFRHFMDTWGFHKSGIDSYDMKELEDALCGELFNTMGYLLTIIQARKAERCNLAKSGTSPEQAES